MSQVRKPKRLGARSFRFFLASSDNARPSRKSSLSLRSFMHSIAFRLHSRKFVMYEFRYAKEHAMARTFHKAFRLVERCLLLGLMVAVSLEAQQSPPSAPAWTGVVRTAGGEPVAGAKVTVYTAAAKEKMTAVTGSDGRFAIADIRRGPNRVSVQLPGRGPTASIGGDITGIAVVLTVSDQNVLSIGTNPQTPAAGVSDGNPSTTSNAASGTSREKLSSQKVNELPLNGRDFSTLLLLAAGTMTDVNGQTNFTQQFAINGQRGVEAVFAMDGADVSDPEMGGSTFTNFNVDAIQELQSSSGWMPADIGRGAAGFTNIVTRSGKSGFHGSFFEFLRNSALDARNYFDHPSIADPGRIPPFGETSSDLLMAGQSCCRKCMTDVTARSILCSIRDSGRCWERPRCWPYLQQQRGGARM